MAACCYRRIGISATVGGQQVCIAEALYDDVDSIVADPGAYTKEQDNRDDASDFVGGGAADEKAVRRPL